MPKQFFWGIIPAAAYWLFAVAVGVSELDCDALMFCGLAFAMVTYPTSWIFADWLAAHGLEIDFISEPTFFDYLLIAIHATICALIVFAVCFGIARLIARLARYDNSLDKQELVKNSNP